MLTQAAGLLGIVYPKLRTIALAPKLSSLTFAIGVDAVGG